MLIVLDSSSPLPLYRQIVGEIKARILAGELKPGDPLPSIRQLASELVTSVITTTRAYQELEAEGLIQTRQGRGTLVADLSAEFRQEMRASEIEAELREVARKAARVGIEPEELKDLLNRVIEKESTWDA